MIVQPVDAVACSRPLRSVEKFAEAPVGTSMPLAELAHRSMWVGKYPPRDDADALDSNLMQHVY